MRSWIKLLLVGLICLAVSISDPAGATSEVAERNPLIVATVEDHPWVIKNTTISKENPIYTGYLLDVLDKICADLNLNYTLQDFGEIGKKSTDGWTGVIGAVVSKKADFALSALNSTEDRNAVLDFTSPLHNDAEKNKTFSLGFPKNSTLTAKVSHVLKKLKNQRFLEQVQENWFVESTDLWDKKKQLTSPF